MGITAIVGAKRDAVTATMPDADGRPAVLRAPWASVLTVTSMGGIAAGTWSWPENASQALRDAMSADTSGVVAFNQPCGPATAHGTPLIRVEFHVRRGGVH